jgi:hypothetical protein
VLEGESLSNDPTALIALGFALPQRTAWWACSWALFRKNRSWLRSCLDGARRRWVTEGRRNRSSALEKAFRPGGTESSNPVPSRGESAANPISASQGHRLAISRYGCLNLTVPCARPLAEPDADGTRLPSYVVVLSGNLSSGSGRAAGTENAPRPQLQACPRPTAAPRSCRRSPGP